MAGASVASQPLTAPQSLRVPWPGTAQEPSSPRCHHPPQCSLGAGGTAWRKWGRCRVLARLLPEIWGPQTNSHSPPHQGQGAHWSLLSPQKHPGQGGPRTGPSLRPLSLWKRFFPDFVPVSTQMNAIFPQNWNHRLRGVCSHRGLRPSALVQMLPFLAHLIWGGQGGREMGEVAKAHPQSTLWPP